MSHNYFRFKQFSIFQEKAAMKVGVDSVLLGAVASFEQAQTVLDIGTGTGLLAFMAEQRTKAKITAVEIEKDAFEQCIENVKFNEKEDKITIVNQSFQLFSESCRMKFDHIICNPPYFKSTYKSPELKRNIARHNAFLSCEELLSGVRKIISENGILSIITPAENTGEYMQLSKKIGIFCFHIAEVFPKKGKSSNRKIIEFSPKKREQNLTQIYIREALTNKYTDQYRSLTKDFYLSF